MWLPRGRACLREGCACRELQVCQVKTPLHHPEDSESGRPGGTNVHIQQAPRAAAAGLAVTLRPAIRTHRRSVTCVTRVAGPGTARHTGGDRVSSLLGEAPLACPRLHRRFPTGRGACRAWDPEDPSVEAGPGGGAGLGQAGSPAGSGATGAVRKHLTVPEKMHVSRTGAGVSVTGATSSEPTPARRGGQTQVWREKPPPWASASSRLSFQSDGNSPGQWAQWL